MQRLRGTSSVLLALVIASAVWHASIAAQGAAAGKADQEVLQAEKDRFAAMVKVDEAALNKVLADDLTYVHSNALLQTKSQFIADLKAGAIKYVSITPSAPDQKVRVFGN